MNKVILASILVFLIAACKNPVVIKHSNAEVSKQENSFRKDILSQGKDGYFLVARGYKFADHIVSAATISQYTHAVILDQANQNVIEATAKGVHVLPLDSFIHKSYKITMVEPYGFNESRAADALDCCLQKSGKPYDFTGTLGIDRTEKYYCSELVVECYEHLVDSLKMPRIITPGKVLDYGESVYITPDRVKE